MNINEFFGREPVEENLRKWFKEKWVRFGPDGKIRGDCARGDDSEGKPKCLPQAKAHALGKKGRASAGARKRREDPNPERSGKAINVATKKKSNESVAEGFLDNMFGKRSAKAGQLKPYEEWKGFMIYYDPVPQVFVVVGTGEYKDKFPAQGFDDTHNAQFYGEQMTDRQRQTKPLRRWPENAAGHMRYESDQLGEFAPVNRDPWGDDDRGEDPYSKPEPRHYKRSIDFFGQFEADHFDKEDFDKATGIFKGYWDYDGKLKQIAYFKFDNPQQAAREFDDSPGMGWYYEPQNESVAEGAMPASVIKAKKRYSEMTPAEFARAHKDKSNEELKSMAWRHGYGKGSTHYVDKRNKGKNQGLNEGPVTDTAVNIIKAVGLAGRKGVKGLWWAVNNPGKAVTLAAVTTHPKETWNAANFAWNFVTDPGHVADVLGRRVAAEVPIAGRWVDKSQAVQDLQKIMGNTATSDTIFKLASLAVDNALPIAGVIALLYGGNKFIQYLRDRNAIPPGEKAFQRISQELGTDRQPKSNMVPAVEDTDIPFNQCPHCGSDIVHESQLSEKQDACYHKVKARYKVWPSAYASGALVQCRKKGAKNWGNSKKESVEESLRPGEYHVATVTLDNGEKRKFKVTFDEGFREQIEKYYAKEGRKVVDIDMDWSVHGIGETKTKRMSRAHLDSVLDSIDAISMGESITEKSQQDKAVDKQKEKEMFAYHGTDPDLRRLKYKVRTTEPFAQSDMEAMLIWLLKKHKTNADSLRKAEVVNVEQEKEIRKQNRALKNLLDLIMGKEKRFQQYTAQVAQGVTPDMKRQAQVAQGIEKDTMGKQGAIERNPYIKQVESQEPNRGGYNKLKDRKDYLDKRDHLFKLMTAPGMSPEDKAVIRQRLADLEYAKNKLLGEGLRISEDRHYAYDGWRYETDTDEEEDNIKIWHYAVKDGQRVMINYSPYAYLSPQRFRNFIDNGHPELWNRGALDDAEFDKEFPPATLDEATDDERAMLAYIQRLVDADSDDAYDAIRDFEGTYGYRPSIYKSRSSRSSFSPFRGASPKPRMTHLHYFDNVDDEIAQLNGMKKDRNNRWYLPQYTTSGRGFDIKAGNLIRNYGKPRTVKLKEFTESLNEADLKQGFDNMRAILKAIQSSTSTIIQLDDGEPMAIDYPFARFIGGFYKQAVKDSRQEEFMTKMSSAAFLDYMKDYYMNKYAQMSKTGSVPGERGVEGDVPSGMVKK